MTDLPRILTIMGSGETSPTHSKTHRDLLARLGPKPVPAVLLDTPVGFQSNADQLSAKAVEYFRVSVQAEIEVATWRSADVDALTTETMMTKLRRARYVFAGPGSPTYALRQWQRSQVPVVLAEKLATGGAVTFASAAALTLGVATVPVYEIYKVGADPAWAPGLDLTTAAGLSCAVIPHYDNAEGQNHDTRFCYLGEERLARLEHELPPGAFVLGVDEHTGLILDLGAGTGTVVGLGGVTVRRQGHSVVFASGSTVTIDDLRAAGEGRATGGQRAQDPAPSPVASDEEGGAASEASLVDGVRRLEGVFEAALEARDVSAAVAAVLELDDLIVAWSGDTLQSDEADLARSSLRGMVVRLGQVAELGAGDPAERVRPFVDALLAVRDRARAARDFAVSDQVRDDLAAAGIELRDAPEGTSWHLLP
jgi:cyanophycinase-like exopeptidase